MRWAEPIAALERWLLPSECLVCRAAVGPSDGLVCPICRSRWRRLPEPSCGRCGQPLDPELDCRLCREWPDRFGSVRSAVWLDAAARRAVHLLKYEGWWRMVSAMAAAMDGLIAPSRRPILVPVPLGAARHRARGYNQSAKLAEAVGARRGLSVDPSILRRRRETRTQTALTPEARRANVAGAFAAQGPVPLDVVLVDDVFTTGATLVAAATELLAAGAASVSAVTFARAERPLESLGREL